MTPVERLAAALHEAEAGCAEDPIGGMGWDCTGPAAHESDAAAILAADPSLVPDPDDGPDDHPDLDAVLPVPPRPSWELGGCGHDPEAIATGEAMARLLATVGPGGFLAIGPLNGTPKLLSASVYGSVTTIGDDPRRHGIGPTLPEALVAALDAGSAERGSE